MNGEVEGGVGEVPKYRIRIIVRAVGGYRLPESETRFNGIELERIDGFDHKALLRSIKSPTAQGAFEIAERAVSGMVQYMSLLGDDSAFVSMGLEGAAGINENLEATPVPLSLPVPPFESIGGFVTDEGQRELGLVLDPTEVRRRTGMALVHQLTNNVRPGDSRVAELGELFSKRDELSERLRVALGLNYDAACSKQLESAFILSYTGLEVLSGANSSASVFDEYAKSQGFSGELRKERITGLLKSISHLLVDAGLSVEAADRVASYSLSARAVPAVAVMVDYLNLRRVAVTKDQAREWGRVRGSLVHTGQVKAEASSAMTSLRTAFREALYAELRLLQSS